MSGNLLTLMEKINLSRNQNPKNSKNRAQNPNQITNLIQIETAKANNILDQKKRCGTDYNINLRKHTCLLNKLKYRLFENNTNNTRDFKSLILNKYTN